VLRKSLGRALNRPDDPTSFVPIYISNSISARLRTHIGASQVKPADVTLTTLDLLIWSAAHRRSGLQPKKAAPGKRASLRELLVPPAHAKGPCDWLKDEFGDEMSEFVKGEITTVAGGALDAGWDAALDKMGEAAAAAAEKGAKAMGMALSWLTVLVSLIGMYGGYSLKVDPDPTKQHMCHPDGESGGPPPGKTVHFIAKVSSKPIMDEGLQNCLDFIGVDLPNKDSAKDCKVRWSAGPGFDKFAWFDAKGLAGAGYGLGRLEQFVDGNGEAKVQLTIKDEAKNAAKQGKQTQGNLIVNCELFTQKTSGAKIAMMIVTQSVSDAVKQWVDKAFPQSARGTMAIEYHTIKKVKCEKSFSKGGMNYTLKAAPTSTEGGLYGPWSGTLTGKIYSQGITGNFEATMSFTIPENGSGQVTGKHSYKSDYKNIVISTDMVINGDLQGTARIADPDGAAKLVLNVDGMNTKLSAKGRGIQGERVNYNKTHSGGGGAAEFVCELLEE
jgi:hypothetical protein